jgi:CPA2 family monovalent cation:H+ antiporter-2
MFTIGLELSLEQIAAVGRFVIWGGLLQIVLTVSLVWAVFLAMGFSWQGGVFAGFLVALSSTAIVLKILSDRQETASLPGRLTTGVLLLQDLSVVPMVLLVPLLSPANDRTLISIGGTVVQALLAVPAIVLVARYLLPWLLHHVVRLRNRELFVLFVILLSLGTAWVTSEFGLSLALGAFIAGLVVSESEYSHQIESEILPFKDAFSGIFFISVGMLLDVGFVCENFATPLLNLSLLLLTKALVILLIFGWLYRSLRMGLLLALSLAQVGEFSFVLAGVGREHGLMTSAGEQMFLAVSILSMIVTPFMIQSGHALGFGLESLMKRPTGRENGKEGALRGHVIILGYGLNGQNLSRVLREVNIPYRILEMNPELVASARAEGQPIFFGDGTRAEVLRQMAIGDARVLVIAISDSAATARALQQARRLNAELHIIVRTRYVAEIERLYRLGAHQVIPEEFETSVEIFARVLQEYHIPRNVIGMQVDLIRRERYGMLRGLKLEARTLDQLSQFLIGTTTDTCLILETSPAVGKSLEELQLRARSGATVIAVVREGKSFHNPGPECVLKGGDVLVLLGSHAELDRATELLSPEAGGELS